MFIFKIQNKLGVLKLDSSFLMREREIVRKVMEKVIIVRAEYMGFSNTFEYIAFSEDFEEIEEGGEIPEYEVKYDKRGIEPIVWFVKKGKKTPYKGIETNE